MHRSLALLAITACVLATGCDNESTTAPSTAPVIFSTVLSPANEVPPIGNAEGSGHGAVQIQFDVTRSTTGAITAATGTMYFQLTGYPAGTTIQGAHIHPAPAGVNGPVIISSGLTAANTVRVESGTGEFTFRNIPADPALVQQIIDNPAAFYFNVHSPTNPGGFSRGQLTRVR
jgi:hypothetical protein